MKDFLYWIVYRLADIHTWIMQLNNSLEPGFSDKELHFLVVGVVGMALFLVVHPIVKFLTRRGWEMAVSWLYTMTLILVLTFGIEIGQKITSTGTMDFADIVFGVGGFLAGFAIYFLLALECKRGRKMMYKKWDSFSDKIPLDVGHVKTCFSFFSVV